VSASDNAGNTSAQSAGASVTTPVCVPSVNLTTPSSGTTISNTVSVAATASDSSGISKVEFYRDNGVLIATATSAPYTNNFDTTTLSNGNHNFYAKAYDMESNSAVSATNVAVVSNVTVGTPPPSGQLVWSRAMTGTTVIPNATAADHLNNVIVAGTFNMSPNFGGGPISYTGYGGFIAKYD